MLIKNEKKRVYLGPAIKGLNKKICMRNMLYISFKLYYKK